MLGIPRYVLNRIMSGHRRLNMSHAVRLEAAGLGAARFWATLQMHHDLFLTQQELAPELEAVARRAEATYEAQTGTSDE